MLHIGDNLRDFERSLSDAMLRQLPFAMARALNDTAHDVANIHLPAAMRREFDRPTRFTLNAFRFERATKTRLTVVVLPKDRIGSRHYLYVQSEGGARPQTGLEKLLASRLRYAGHIVAVTPGPAMRRDAHGNMSRGQLNQIISAIQAQRDSRNNTTSESRSRHRGRSQYFVPREGSRLSPGVWERTASGQLRKVLHFTAASPRYERRFTFVETADRRARSAFPVHLSRRLQEAWATRR